MKIKERKIMIRVSKTIQEEEYEPFNIQIEDGAVLVDSTKKEIKLFRRQLYNDCKKELFHLIDKRLKELEDDND